MGLDPVFCGCRAFCSFLKNEKNSLIDINDIMKEVLAFFL
jgi:hypothetical protein